MYGVCLNIHLRRSGSVICAYGHNVNANKTRRNRVKYLRLGFHVSLKTAYRSVASPDKPVRIGRIFIKIVGPNAVCGEFE